MGKGDGEAASGLEAVRKGVVRKIIMKLTKSQLKQIIKEELETLKTIGDVEDTQELEPGGESSELGALEVSQMKEEIKNELRAEIKEMFEKLIAEMQPE